MKMTMFGTALAMLLATTAAYATPSSGTPGPQGPQGEQGPAGPQGPAGTNGTNGATGPAGADGTNGTNGTNGVDGTNGTNGVDGATGATGATGAAGTNGTNGTNGTSGADATANIDAVNDDIENLQNNDEALAALGGLELRQGGKGVTSWSAGLGGIYSDNNMYGGIGVGIHYGIQDNLGIYGKLSKSFNGDNAALFVGFEGQF